MDIQQQFLFYCINLEHRKDRYEHMKNEFKKIGLDNVTFYHPIKHEKGYIGCFQSHLYIFEELVKSKYNYCVVFEDDVIFENNAMREMERCYNFAINNDFDFIRLSHVIYEIEHGTIDKNIYKAKSIFASCYIVSRIFAKRFLEYNFDELILEYDHVDIAMAGKSNNAYVLYNAICYQGHFGSDNQWVIKDDAPVVNKIVMGCMYKIMNSGYFNSVVSKYYIKLINYLVYLKYKCR